MKTFPMPARPASQSEHIAGVSSMTEADRICHKWASIIGQGFHPDNRGQDYWPRFSKAEIADYDKDMRTLFLVASDPYECAVAARGWDLTETK